MPPFGVKVKIKNKAAFKKAGKGNAMATRGFGQKGAGAKRMANAPAAGKTSDS